MLSHLLPLRRRQTPADPATPPERRSGAAVRRRPDPMPRLRWY